jgi:hypothetical protein
MVLGCSRREWILRAVSARWAIVAATGQVVDRADGQDQPILAGTKKR